MKVKKYKAFIFDFDDTLVESRIMKWEHHKHVAKEFYNLILTEEELLFHWGKPFEKMVSELYKSIDNTEKIIEKLLETNHKFHKKEKKEAGEILKILKENNKFIGIISATNKKYIIDDFKRLGYNVDTINYLQGTTDSEYHKPDPRVFEPLFEKLKENNIKKDEVVYIGDSLDDLKASSGAGIDFIALTNGLYDRDDFKKHGAKEIVENILEIKKFI